MSPIASSAQHSFLQLDIANVMAMPTTMGETFLSAKRFFFQPSHSNHIELKGFTCVENDEQKNCLKILLEYSDCISYL